MYPCERDGLMIFSCGCVCWCNSWWIVGVSLYGFECPSVLRMQMLELVRGAVWFDMVTVMGISVAMTLGMIMHGYAYRCRVLISVCM